MDIQYLHVLYLIAICGVLILAYTAVYNIRRAETYRRICVEYRIRILRMQGMTRASEEIEEEIAQRAEEIEKGVF